MNLKDTAPVAAAFALAGGIAAGVVALIASGSPEPAPAVVTTQPAEPTRMAPRCFETSITGAQDCAWIPVTECLTDETGDDAIPDGFDGCFWDAESRGNHMGASYVYWRQNRG